jgi:exosortase
VPLPAAPSAAGRAEEASVVLAPERTDWVPLAAVAAGVGVLFSPLFLTWAHSAWTNGSHELVMLGVAVWLVIRDREAIALLPTVERTAAGWVLLGVGLVLSMVARIVEIPTALVLSLVAVLAGCMWQFKGWPGVRLIGFSLAFLLFAIPLPYELVLWLTGPLKEGVSAVSTAILWALGFPAGQSGVVITIGQYQLLVAEACAGLQTMFTLEAMGLLYARLLNHTDPLRNTLLAIVVIPISFVANVVRVVLLAILTYGFGDDVGQGFLHGSAGIVLFGVALGLIAIVNAVAERLWPSRKASS